jgi:hypothetical protein
MNLKREENFLPSLLQLDLANWTAVGRGRRGTDHSHPYELPGDPH